MANISPFENKQSTSLNANIYTQGWTPDFIPLVLEKGLDLNLHDELINIPDGAGVSMAQSLAKNEGILTGISGGATMWAAVETAKHAPEGSVWWPCYLILESDT